VSGTTEVIAWEDQSGNDNHLSPSLGNEPSLELSVVNSLPAISSYGLPNALLETVDALPDLSTGGTVFLVAKQSTVDGATNFDIGGVFVGAGSLNMLQIQRGNTNTGSLHSIRGGIDAAAYAITGDEVEEDTFVLICLRNDGTDNFISVNDGVETTAVAGNGSYVGTSLSVFNTLSGVVGNKQIAEILIYTEELSSGDISDIKDILNDKYNLY